MQRVKVSPIFGYYKLFSRYFKNLSFSYLSLHFLFNEIFMILVTGAGGFLGLEIVRCLQAAQQPVRALYHRQLPANAPREGVMWVQGDILDLISLQAVFEGVSQVYHCAAVVSFSPKHQAAMLKTNCEGTANVVNMALQVGIQKLLHVSSVAALGRSKITNTPPPPLDETTRWVDSPLNSEYAKSKYKAEKEVWRAMAEGLNAVIINPSIILGPWDWNSGTAKFFAQMYDEFPYYTTGTNGFIDVQDVARAAYALMNSDISGERFVLSGGTHSYQQLLESIAFHLGKKPPTRHARPWMLELLWRWEALKYRLGGTEPLLTRETAISAQEHYDYDTSKIRRTLNFEFTPLEKTLARTAAVFLKEHEKKVD